MSDLPAVVAPPGRNPLALGLAAARANVLPALLLWVFGSAIVGAYYLWPAARPTFDLIASWKVGLGFFYAMIFTAFFAGLVPYLLQALQRGGAKRWAASHLAYLLLFWAVKGVEVDLLYQGQAWLFGEGRDLGTLATKMFVDQFIYVPLWAGPTMVMGLLLTHSGFSLRRMRHHLRPGWYRRLVVPVILPNWLVWVPAVMLIYMLPTVLQLPVQNVVMCLWVTMVMFITGEQHRTEPDDAGR